MKVQVPSEETFKARYRLSPEWCEDHPVLFAVRYAIFCDGIAYANEQLASSTPTKRPFLSDTEIDDEANRVYGPAYVFPYAVGARWARDRYEAAFVADVPNVEPKWQPVVGQLCRSWGKTENTPVRTGYFVKIHDGVSHEFTFDGSMWESRYCALIENLDEIGKPPSYFQERGRCTV